MLGVFPEVGVVFPGNEDDKGDGAYGKGNPTD